MILAIIKSIKEFKRRQLTLYKRHIIIKSIMFIDIHAIIVANKYKNRMIHVTCCELTYFTFNLERTSYVAGWLRCRIIDSSNLLFIN